MVSNVLTVEDVKLLGVMKDYERLKRLDEKVKNKKAELKRIIQVTIENQLSGGKYSKSDDRKCLDAWKTELNYLESLYK